MTKEVAEPKVSQAPRKHSQEFKLGVVKRLEAGESLASVCNEFSLSRGLAHKWKLSYQEKGLEGLQVKSSRHLIINPKKRVNGLQSQCVMQSSKNTEKTCR